MTRNVYTVRWRSRWVFNVHRCEACRLRINLGHFAIVWGWRGL